MHEWNLWTSASYLSKTIIKTLFYKVVQCTKYQKDNRYWKCIYDVFVVFHTVEMWNRVLAFKDTLTIIYQEAINRTWRYCDHIFLQSTWSILHLIWNPSTSQHFTAVIVWSIKQVMLQNSLNIQAEKISTLLALNCRPFLFYKSLWLRDYSENPTQECTYCLAIKKYRGIFTHKAGIGNVQWWFRV